MFKIPELLLLNITATTEIDTYWTNIIPMEETPLVCVNVYVFVTPSTKGTF